MAYLASGHMSGGAYTRDGTVRVQGAMTKSTLAAYMQHYNDNIMQLYLCTGPLSKGMELIMQLRAGILPLDTMTANFGRQSASRQIAHRECCKSYDLAPELGRKAETPEHFCLTVLFTRHKGKSCGRS